LKGKKTAILILAMVLSVSAPAVVSKDKFSIDYVFEPIMIDGQWMIKDTMIREIAGEPLMLYRPASILLPEGATLKDVKIHHSKPIVQGGFELPWGQHPCTFSGPAPEKVGPNKSIYNSNNWYPEKLFEVVGVNSFRGFQILNVHLYPVQYQPKSGTVKFYEKLIVEVQFGKGMKNKLYRGLQSDKTDVISIVDNPEVISTYDDGGTPLATEEYIIVTSSTLKSTFQELVTWKASFVNGASVYDTAYIYNNYTGVDNQEKIRAFIIDKYTNNGTKYVLLGGDTGIVPYRGFYVSSGGYTDTDMAADMYYAHLDGNWDTDGDSRYAEPGEEDWYAEVAVGRAPVDNTTEAEAFIDKVISYEQMNKPKRVMLHQSRVQPNNSPDSRCLAYNCDDWIPGGYTIDYVFEENQTVSKTVWRNAWAAGPLAVAHIGHGNTDIYHINYEVGSTVSWDNSDVSSLTNTFFPWHTSVACICGEFEANDCLAEEYVKDDCGAIACYMNDNYGWFSTLDACQYSGEFVEMQFRALFSDGYEKLGEFLNQSKSYMVSSAQSNSTYRWCFYEINLIGDPETPVSTRSIPPPTDTVTITNPADGSIVCCTVNVTVETTGCIDEVKFYIDGVLEDTDTSSPFEYSFYVCDYPESTNITIVAEGYCGGVLKDQDSVTITKDCYLTITNPSPGEVVSGTVMVTADTNAERVKFYIDNIFMYEDMTAPFQYSWDTTQYPDGDYTIRAEGYCIGYEDLKVTGTVTFTVGNVVEPYVTITNPSEGQTVSGTVTCTADSNCDSVKWYINGTFKAENTSAPFQYIWDTTTAPEDADSVVKAEGYNGGVYQCQDSVTVFVNNEADECLGTTLLSLLVLFGAAGIYRRR
jgi:hypothetical protein